jgi:hypothetical protein
VAGGWEAIPITAVTLILIAFIGGLFGLIASSFSRTGQAAPFLALFFIVPQFLLSGSIIPLPQVAAPFQILALGNPMRYGFELLLTGSGYGKDITTGRCTGEAILTQCKFPGISQFITGLNEHPQPEKPAADPALMSLPAQPVYQTGQSLEDYVQKVNQYTLSLESFQGNLSTYLSSLNTYMERINQWQQAQSLAIGEAEGVIERANADYGDRIQTNLIWPLILLAGFSAILVAIFGVIQAKKDGSGI